MQDGRRRFLQMACAAAGTLGLGGAAGCSSQTTGQASATGPVAAGNVKDVAAGTLAGVGDKPVALGRDAGGLYAMTTICTHQQCNIRVDGSVSAAGLSCSCHGSTFDANGAVTRGPAPRPLEHYKVELAADGSITIQANQIVAADFRTPVA